MPKYIENMLSDHLYQFLKSPQVVSVATVNNKTLFPVVSCISWIYAKNEKVIYFAIDSRSITVENINANGKVCIHVMTNDSVYSINGTAIIQENPMDDIPFNLACVKVEVEEVRDVMFYGSKIAQIPQITLTYDKKVAKKIEEQVYEKLTYY